MRCGACESEWDADVSVRRSAKHIFVPPIAILAGGVAFGLLFPLFLGGAIGATAVAGAATLVGTAAGLGTCRVIDGAARAGFLREHARQLPAARIVRRHRARTITASR
jgi:hypothetical protein